MARKYVYFFDEGKKEMKELLGGKGANLAEMTNMKLPIPPGFTITTETCDEYYKSGKRIPEELIQEIKVNVEKLEKAMKSKLGDNDNPLLLSVRSGAASSMPGMMDTVLNLGLNDKVVDGIIKKTGNDRFAWDSYRRFIQMFSDVVMEVPAEKYSDALEDFKKEKKVNFDTQLTANDLRELSEIFKTITKAETGKLFPDNPFEQLMLAVAAVFGSWNNSRAVLYRRLNNIHGLLGTAVNIQAMVFGNMGNDCGSGVCFSRNPSTGENIFYGEYLMNAQGEDVVAGVRTPKNMDDLKKEMPQTYKELNDIRLKLEKHFKDMQDMEFTIQEGKLYMLQTRNGKRTAAAALKVAVDMVKEGLINEKEAISRLDAAQLDQLLHPTLDPKAEKDSVPLVVGLPASPGAAVGEIVFDAEKAHDMAEEGHKVILVRIETSPEDLIGMNAAQGILTARGGMTSHAAVVARGMGKSCICGCESLTISYKDKTITTGDGSVLHEGDIISLNGSTGKVYDGSLDVKEPDISGDFEKVMIWSDKFRTLNVRTNADTPHDTAMAVKFGAEGIGLCRTEHMFFDEQRIFSMRKMILADTIDERKEALMDLIPYQREDFVGLFKELKGLPATIRLLDPPLHEFLPKEKDEISELAKATGKSVAQVEEKIASLHEVNPMLGHRGCRLGNTYPEITAMQARAIIEAACLVDKANPEIMIPLVGDVKEFLLQKEIIETTAKEVFAEQEKEVKYKVGTMVEVPRGALMAGEIAKEAEFFSFGTNDLTQMTYGFSRDDVSKFLPKYLKLGLLKNDPFVSLDQEGVGQLVALATKKGKAARKDIKLGICGEHGGDPASIDFCHRAGLSYVSCSPYRVPIARLAAAQAALRNK
ncbi:MAG: pyruvate, phosphate dikinase [Patescibacteria group bacterium]